MQNISRLVSRQSDARSNGALRFIPIFNVSCPMHKTCSYDCKASQNVCKLISEEIEQAKQYLRELPE